MIKQYNYHSYTENCILFSFITYLIKVLLEHISNYICINIYHHNIK